MTDKEKGLLERARAFDMDALSEVYDYYSPSVYRYAMRLLGDACLAEDCVADTFHRFLLAIKNGGGPQEHLQAYLFRIAHNWITDLYRRQPPAPLELDENLRSEADRPEVEDVIEQKRVRAALVCLTPDQRQVVTLKFLEGWENEAIASLVDKPVSAVKALQHRALNALRRMLLPEEEVI